MFGRGRIRFTFILALGPESHLHSGRHMYAGGTTGLAILRRDGFASMNAGLSTESLTTRPVIFNKGKHLFVNTNTKKGMLQVEILEQSRQSD